jgi:dienelactone hydrolase
MTKPWFAAATAIMAASLIGIATLNTTVNAQNNATAPNTGAQPLTVNFGSADGKTWLVGYLFMPAQPRAQRSPAVVMMHGRAGPYSLNVKDKGPYNASTLSKRHKMWGQSWSALGYLAVLVDSFSPRGYPGGFEEGSYEDRPDVVNEVTVRPLDAYGALGYLRSRTDVAYDRIGLQGWSNGGSAALVSAATDAPGISNPTPATGFRAALVFYAGCALHERYDAKGYLPYTKVLAFHGMADRETLYSRCQRLVERSRSKGGDISIKLYPGATHSFDDPGQRRQRVPANAAATADAIASSEALFEQILAQGMPPR